MRPDLLLRGHSPAMTGLMHRGSYTLLARTVTEGYTIPSHVSMLTGVVPANHGVTWDHHVEDSYPNVSTIFELAKKAGYTTGVVTGETKLIVLTKPGTLDWSHNANENQEDDLGTSGPTIRRDFDLALVSGPGIDTMATFATACAALGIAVPEPREGRPVMEIFEPPLAMAR